MKRPDWLYRRGLLSCSHPRRRVVRTITQASPHNLGGWTVDGYRDDCTRCGDIVGMASL